VKFLLDHDVPENLIYLLRQLDHEVVRLRDVLPVAAPDSAVIQFAYAHDCLLLTCNRDDFIELAATQPHHGIIVIVRRRTRAAERAALLRLFENAGEDGLRNNVNFA
jgi:predicted nuclease of predicted toxin-antitoxin system